MLEDKEALPNAVDQGKFPTLSDASSRLPVKGGGENKRPASLDFAVHDAGSVATTVQPGMDSIEDKPSLSFAHHVNHLDVRMIRAVAVDSKPSIGRTRRVPGYSADIQNYDWRGTSAVAES